MSQKLALIGNPNIGKSSLFNRLTGLNQKVGNFAGVTIEKKSGFLYHKGSEFEITDLPGTYSLIPKSPDEEVVFKHLLGAENKTMPDLLLVVVDASNMERNLVLFSQVADLQMPTMVALTMVDVAREKGQNIDFVELESLLGCPVIPINARTGEGIEKLKERFNEAKSPDLSLFDIHKSMDREIEYLDAKLPKIPNNGSNFILGLINTK
jgi:ferrous iron transport protein B